MDCIDTAGPDLEQLQLQPDSHLDFLVGDDEAIVRVTWAPAHETAMHYFVEVRSPVQGWAPYFDSPDLGRLRAALVQAVGVFLQGMHRTAKRRLVEAPAH